MNTSPSSPFPPVFSDAGAGWSYRPTSRRRKFLGKSVPYVVTFILGAGVGAAGASDDAPPQPEATPVPTVVYLPTPVPTVVDSPSPVPTVIYLPSPVPAPEPPAAPPAAPAAPGAEQGSGASEGDTARRLVMPVRRRSIEASPATGPSWTATRTASPASGSRSDRRRRRGVHGTLPRSTGRGLTQQPCPDE